MFRNIGNKIISVVALVVVLGLVTLTIFYAKHQAEGILAQNERTMLKLTESVYQSLQTIMIAGYADIAQSFADNLKNVPDVIDFRILRVNGSEAFRDNATIHTVNERVGEELFFTRKEVALVPVLPPTHKELRRATETAEVVSYYETGADGEQLLTFLAPLENQEDCHRCHGASHRVRGVLKLTTSLGPVMQDINNTRQQSVFILVAAVLSIIVITAFILRRSVVLPIKLVTDAMTRAAKGDLTQQVPVVGRDEISEMALSFNSMISQLMQTYGGLQQEQDKLTTIILSAREGIVVTNSDGQVVLVNPAAETLLGKSAEQIIRDGFLQLMEDPETMRRWLDNTGDSSEATQTVLYKERTLTVYASTIRGQDQKIVGSAMLLRDITEEKNLEEKLRVLSTTDGLTKLFNRRHLDIVLEKEFSRSKRYQMPLSILMFDVDHFKRFNDDYGHEMGDVVLQAIAEKMREAVRKVDVPCRYGGEEFLIILPNTGQSGAADVAERLRESIEAMEVQGLRVTISIGVAESPAIQAQSAEAFIAAADGALYEAKEAGRNQVIIAKQKVTS